MESEREREKKKKDQEGNQGIFFSPLSFTRPRKGEENILTRNTGWCCKTTAGAGWKLKTRKRAGVDNACRSKSLGLFFLLPLKALESI